MCVRPNTMSCMPWTGIIYPIVLLLRIVVRYHHKCHVPHAYHVGQFILEVIGSKAMLPYSTLKFNNNNNSSYLLP